MKPKYYQFTLPGLAGMFMLFSCTRPQETAPDSETGTPEPVRVMTIEYKNMARTEEVTAEINAFEETHLAPSLSGRIMRIHVDVNDRVSAGQVLAEMDPTQLSQARVQYETMKKDLARMDTLLRYGSITQQAYDQQKSGVEIQEVLIRNLEKNTILRAPYNGLVTGRYYNEGELFSPTPNTAAGKAALFTLMQIDRLKVYIHLPEKYVPVIEPGLTAELRTDVFPEEVFEGKVYRIYPTVDPMTRTFQVEIHLPNPGKKIRPGMFARASLRLGESRTLVAPAIAVLQQTGTNERYIFINDGGKAKKITVQLGRRFDDQLEIISSELKGGEQLIVAGQKRLEDQTPVEIIQE